MEGVDSFEAIVAAAIAVIVAVFGALMAMAKKFRDSSRQDTAAQLAAFKDMKALFTTQTGPALQGPEDTGRHLAMAAADPVAAGVEAIVKRLEGIESRFEDFQDEQAARDAEHARVRAKHGERLARIEGMLSNPKPAPGE